MGRMSVTVENREIEGPHGSIPVRVYGAAPGQSRPGFVWNHGGGFIGGDLDMPEADWVSRQLAEAGIVVVSVFYRLSDADVHYPVPSDDVRAAFLWTFENAESLGIDTDRLSLGGGSAGANLAAGVAKRLRDEGATQPRSVVLVYPVLHRTLPEPSEELAAKLATLDENQQFSAEDMQSIITAFLGSTDAPGDEYAVPAKGELRGLQPTFILNSDFDSLRASGEAYGAALVTAGNDVLVIREENTWHGHLNEPDQPGALRSVQRMLAWLQLPPLVGQQHSDVTKDDRS
jgi:acetyl esterase